MKKAIKWTIIIVIAVIFLTVLALIIAPTFIDINRYKPMIEERISKAIGRDVTINGKLKLRLFPTALLRLSDLHIGNPAGFKEKDFISLKSFDVQIRLIPFILSRDLQVKRFIMNRPYIFLIKNKNGMVNWKFASISGSPKEIELRRKDAQLTQKSSEVALPFKNISVDEFGISDAAIIWIDQVTGKKMKITGINLRLKNISFFKPIGFELTANLEGNPIKIDGKIGPLGKIPGKGIMPLSVKMNMFQELILNLKGKVKDASSKNLSYDFDLKINPFSLRRILKRFKITNLRFHDPNALQKIALSAHIKGTAKEIDISNGIFDLDQSHMKFFVKAKEFNRPNVLFDIKLDKIDIDRYIPITPRPKKKIKKAAVKASLKGKKATSIDYSSLRKLVMNGQIKIGSLIVKRLHFKNIYVKLAARDGIIQVRPFNMNIYKGIFSMNTIINVKGKKPITKLALNIKNVLIEPLVKDLIKEDIITGTFNMDLSLSMKGDTPDEILSSLNGGGNLLMKDGYILGVDLSGMIQNIKAAFGLAQARKLKKKTLFSEIRSKFYIKNGVFQTKETYLISPKLKVNSKGKANLLKQRLSFRITPEYIKNPERPIAVPIILSGTFSSLKIAPDLTGIAKELLFKKLFKEKKGTKEKKEENPIEEMGKELLKGIFGR